MGVSEIEFVGHKFDCEGISFSDKKLDGIKQFVKPVTKKDLKSYLGLANYFRDHIRHHSTLTHTLQEMIGDYSKKSRSNLLQWTPTLDDAYDRLQNALINCQKLYFVDNTLQIHLATDASDYALGAYVYQLTPEGQEIPIRFISKSFAREQLRWSVPEKECYAIVFTLNKLDYLLRDVHFVLHTDHENLTRCYSSGSPKVLRWQILIQGYDKEVRHIKGIDNLVADSLSRFAPVSDTEEFLSLLWEEETAEITYQRYFTSPEEILMATPIEFAAPMVENNGGPEENPGPQDGLINPHGENLPHDIYKKISAVHNSYVGHHGVERTLKKLFRANQRWPYMRDNVREFIKRCPCCQKLSDLKVAFVTQPYTVGSYEPMEYISFDTIGPLEEDAEGNKFIIAIIDNFSRFLRLYPCKDTTAKSAVRALMQHIGAHGHFRKWLSDRGTQFVSEVTKELTKLTGGRDFVTVPASKQENSIVERSNKETMRHLRALVYEANKHDNWSLISPMVELIHNSEVGTSTGVAPRELLYGKLNRDDNPNMFISTEELDDPATRPLSDWATRMLTVQNKLIRVCQERSRQHHDTHIAHNATTAPLTSFPVNSYVLQSYPDGTNGKHPPHKLMTKWKGPFKVLEVVGPHYTILNLVTQTQTKCHVSRLKQFRYFPGIHDPTDIAGRDAGESVVERIEAHTGSRLDKWGMQFLVKWQGQGPEENLWMDYSNLRFIPAFHTYCLANDLRTIIPRGNRSARA
jgi:hypothetical protein